MHRSIKIATCCYCGSRRTLVLDQAQHELVCANCGAPLHTLKRLPTPDPVPAHPRPAKRQPERPVEYKDRGRPKPRPKKKRRKPLLKKIFEEVIDVIEDIID